MIEGFDLQKLEIVICENCEGYGCPECNMTGRIEKSIYVLKLSNFDEIKTNEELKELCDKQYINIKNSDFKIKFIICDDCNGKGYYNGKAIFECRDISYEKVACRKCKGKGRYKIIECIAKKPYSWFEEPKS